jgi:hypothetical protein
LPLLGRADEVEAIETPIKERNDLGNLHGKESGLTPIKG